MVILGISAYYHDSAAALIQNGDILFAAQEERFTRKRHDAEFPSHAIQAALQHTGIKTEQIDAIVFYDKPLLKFDRLLESYFATVPRGFNSFRKSMPVWIKQKLFLRDLLKKEFKKIGFQSLKSDQILFSEHHLSHAASAFYPSPFSEAAILTMDGVGEWSTTSISFGKDKHVGMLEELHFPHSLGLLYSAFTAYCGFTVNSGEYKLMGLAPYGKPVYTELILQHLIDLKSDGSFRLQMSYFSFISGLKMYNKAFEKLFQNPARKPESEMTQFYMDVAASIQKVTELVVCKLAERALKITGASNLCLSGGVALNCVANGVLAEHIKPKALWIQPAAGDAGGALGAALAYYYSVDENKRVVSNEDAMHASLLGNDYTHDALESILKSKQAVYHKMETAELLPKVAQILANGDSIGWFQGRMEFGPRALGNRSILADPRPAEMQKALNLKIKFRESFRPFAPAILEEKADEYFENIKPSPYMLYTFLATEKGRELKATTHVDGSARVQTVTKNDNPLFHSLLQAFDQLTGCPALVNTSFNVRGEPIVNTPEEAYHCFMSTGLDALVLGPFLLIKKEQPMAHGYLPNIGQD